MRVLLLSILVIGALAKDKTDKNIVHDVLYKDNNVLNFGEICKTRIHQRLNNLNLDNNNRHIIDDIVTSVGRCVNDCKSDYKVNRDDNRYRTCVGGLMGNILGEIDYLDRNNFLNNVVEVDNVVNRIRRCDEIVHNVDVNNNRNFNWGTNRGGDNYDTNRNDNLNRDVSVFGNDRDVFGRFGGNLNRGDNWNRDGGQYNNRYSGLNFNDYWNNDRMARYQRSLNFDDSNNDDSGIVGYYRVIYGIIGNDNDDNVRGGNQDNFGRGGNSNRNYNYGRYNFGGRRAFNMDNDRDIFGRLGGSSGGRGDLYGRNNQFVNRNNFNDRDDIYGHNTQYNTGYGLNNEDIYNVGRNRRVGEGNNDYWGNGNNVGINRYNAVNRRYGGLDDDNNRYNTNYDHSGHNLYYGIRHGYDRGVLDN